MTKLILWSSKQTLARQEIEIKTTNNLHIMIHDWNLAIFRLRIWPVATYRYSTDFIWIGADLTDPQMDIFNTIMTVCSDSNWIRTELLSVTAWLTIAFTTYTTDQESPNTSCHCCPLFLFVTPCEALIAKIARKILFCVSSSCHLYPDSTKSLLLFIYQS